MPETTAEVAKDIPVFTQLEVAEAPKQVPESAEQAPQAETPAKESTGQAPEKQEPEKSGKSRFERRLDKAYRRAAEAEAKAKIYEQQIQSLSQPKDDGPKLDQFTDVEEYAKAKAKHETEKALRSLQSRNMQNSEREFQQKVVTDWESKSSSSPHEDFDEVVGEMAPTSPFHIAIMKADPEVAYHLGKTPSELQRIGSLDIVGQIMEIAKLESKLTAEPVKPKPSKAPAPIKPLQGAADTSGEPDSKNTEAWIKWRNKQVHGKR